MRRIELGYSTLRRNPLLNEYSSTVFHSLPRVFSSATIPTGGAMSPV